MKEALKPIIEIQELDIKMIRLMRMKKMRQDELKQIKALREELVGQLETKETEIKNLSDECLLFEQKIEEHKEKIKRLETQQTSIKKIEEFNAISKEINLLEKEKGAFEQNLSNLVDKKNMEEELYEKTKATLVESDENSRNLEAEIKNTIREINREGQELMKAREEVAKQADPQILAIYERLLRNKKDRVLVSIENRNCMGCHIALTAQHENLVRKGDKIVFCEHCSRIHYWSQETNKEEEEQAVSGTSKRRRRRGALTGQES